MTDKLKRLSQILADMAPGVVAVSGGVDSRFLAAFAWRQKLDYVAVFMDGPHMSPAERSWAMGWLERNAPEFHVIAHDPLEVPEIRNTTDDRCYYCKHLGFEKIVALARKLGRPGVVDGGSGSDLNEYRPGVRALRQLEVKSPLALSDMTKSEIRAAGAEIGLEWPDQPSRPCLLTRFNYGMQAEAQILEQLGRVEGRAVRPGAAEFPPAPAGSGTVRAACAGRRKTVF